MNLYDVDGYNRPLLLSPEHADLLDADAHKGHTATPGRNAAKSAWIGHAVDLGVDPAVAEAMTKAQLIDAYGEA